MEVRNENVIFKEEDLEIDPNLWKRRLWPAIRESNVQRILKVKDLKLNRYYRITNGIWVDEYEKEKVKVFEVRGENDSEPFALLLDDAAYESYRYSNGYEDIIGFRLEAKFYKGLIYTDFIWYRDNKDNDEDDDEGYDGDDEDDYDEELEAYV